MCRFPFPLLSHLLLSFVISTPVVDVTTTSCTGEGLHGHNCTTPTKLCLEGTCKSTAPNLLFSNDCSSGSGAGILCNSNPNTAGTVMGVCKGTMAVDCIPLSNGACANENLGKICVAGVSGDYAYPGNLGRCTATNSCTPLKPDGGLLGAASDCNATSKVNAICIHDGASGFLGICVSKGVNQCKQPTAGTFFCNDANAGKVCVDNDTDDLNKTKVGICNNVGGSAVCKFDEMSLKNQPSSCTTEKKLCVTEGTKIQAGVCLAANSTKCVPPENGFHVGACTLASVDKICLSDVNKLGYCTYVGGVGKCTINLSVPVCADDNAYCVAGDASAIKLVFGFCETSTNCAPFNSICTSNNYGKRCLSAEEKTGVCTPAGCLEADLAKDIGFHCSDDADKGKVCVKADNSAAGLCAKEQAKTPKTIDCVTSGIQVECKTPGSLCIAKDTAGKAHAGVCLNNLSCRVILDNIVALNGQYNLGNSIKSSGAKFNAQMLNLQIIGGRLVLRIGYGDGSRLLDFLDGSIAFKAACTKDFICVNSDREPGVCSNAGVCEVAPFPTKPPKPVFPTFTTTTTLRGCVALEKIGIKGCPAAAKNGDSCTPVCEGDAILKTAKDLKGTVSDFIKCSNGSWSPKPACVRPPKVLKFRFYVDLQRCNKEAVFKARQAALAALAQNLSGFKLSFVVTVENCEEAESEESESVVSEEESESAGENSVVEENESRQLQEANSSVRINVQTEAETDAGREEQFSLLSFDQLKPLVEAALRRVDASLKRNPELEVLKAYIVDEIKEGLAESAIREVERDFSLKFSDNLSTCVLSNCLRALPGAVKSVLQKLYGDASEVEVDLDGDAGDPGNDTDCLVKDDNDVSGRLKLRTSRLARFTQTQAEKEVQFFTSGFPFRSLLEEQFGKSKKGNVKICRYLIIHAAESEFMLRKELKMITPAKGTRGQNLSQIAFLFLF